MTEPISFRPSDETNPKRGELFEKVLNRRRASMPEVLRGLIDAYINSNGLVAFPVELVSLDGDGPPKAKPVEKAG